MIRTIKHKHLDNILIIIIKYMTLKDGILRAKRDKILATRLNDTLSLCL